MGGALSWVASAFDVVASHGWGAVVFAGMGATCSLVLIGSFGLIAWRYFHPLPALVRSTTAIAPVYFSAPRNALAMPPAQPQAGPLQLSTDLSQLRAEVSSIQQQLSDTKRRLQEFTSNTDQSFEKSVKDMINGLGAQSKNIKDVLSRQEACKDAFVDFCTNTRVVLKALADERDLKTLAHRSDYYTSFLIPASDKYYKSEENWIADFKEWCAIVEEFWNIASSWDGTTRSPLEFARSTSIYTNTIPESDILHSHLAKQSYYELIAINDAYNSLKSLAFNYLKDKSRLV